MLVHCIFQSFALGYSKTCLNVLFIRFNISLRTWCFFVVYEIGDNISQRGNVCTLRLHKIMNTFSQDLYCKGCYFFLSIYFYVSVLTHFILDGARIYYVSVIADVCVISD
jgi:hypothetical protein